MLKYIFFGVLCFALFSGVSTFLLNTEKGENFIGRFLDKVQSKPVSGRFQSPGEDRLVAQERIENIKNLAERRRQIVKEKTALRERAHEIEKQESQSVSELMEKFKKDMVRLEQASNSGGFSYSKLNTSWQALSAVHDAMAVNGGVIKERGVSGILDNFQTFHNELGSLSNQTGIALNEHDTAFAKLKALEESRQRNFGEMHQIEQRLQMLNNDLAELLRQQQEKIQERIERQKAFAEASKARAQAVQERVKERITSQQVAIDRSKERLKDQQERMHDRLMSMQDRQDH